MKKLIQGISLLAFSVSMAATGQTYNAKHVGKGFTSLNDDFTASISNPALANSYDQDDDFYLSLGFGAKAADEHDVFDTGEDIADAIDALEASIRQAANANYNSLEEIKAAQATLTAEKDAIINDFNSIDEKPVKVDIGVNFLALIPNQYLSIGVFAQQYGQIGLAVNYNDNDNILLQDAIDNLNADLLEDNNGDSNLNSGARAFGYSVIEAGVLFGRNIISTDSYDLDLGAKIKHQSLDIVFIDKNIREFDEDDFDLSEEAESDSAINYDLGVYTSWGAERQWSFALVANNLASQEIQYTTTGANSQEITFEVKPQVTAGFAYKNDWVTLAGEVDLTDRQGLAFSDQENKPKFAALGVAFDWSEHLQFRLGTRTDMNDVENDVVTVGLGISPGDVLSLDIAAVAGDEDAAGFALQFGLKI
jgi:hypothetical protein